MRRRWVAVSCVLVSSSVLVAAWSCRSVPSVDDVLLREGGEARVALEETRAARAGYDEWMAAGRSLAAEADLRLQRYLATSVAARSLAVESQIDEEDAAPVELKGAIRSLCKEGAAACEKALDERPDSFEARLWLGFHDSLVAWSGTTTEALLGGAATRLPRMTKSLVEADAEAEGAAALRLRGRFLCRAPWPYKDVDEGRELLERAVRVAPNSLNLLFLGDAAWLDGDPKAARAAWERGVDAPTEISVERSEEFIQIQLAERLRAAERAGRGD